MYYDPIPSSWIPVIVDLFPFSKGEIVKWYRGEGFVNNIDEPLCRIESTDPLLGGEVELSCPTTGFLHIVKEVGDKVDERDNIVAYIEPKFSI